MRGRGAIGGFLGVLLTALTACGAAVAPHRLARAGVGVAAAPVFRTSTTTQPSPVAPPGSFVPNQPDGTATRPTADRIPQTETAGIRQPAWVAVPVLTVWERPDFVRPVDSPLLQAAPAVGKWIASMSYSQKLDLGPRMATQALLDDPLTVLDVEGDWAHVLVNDQTGSVYTDGIEGWVPTAQIAFSRPSTSGLTATIKVPFARAGNLSLSYGTRLPVVGSSATSFEVSTPEGLLEVSKSDVSTGPVTSGGVAVLRQAEQFLGLPYLWAGTSAYGYDCSGLTYAVYRLFGVTLARDAADQAQQGTPVAKNALRPGDLVFFAAGGSVHHVAVYAGSGMMLDAPQTGGRVELVPLWNSYLSAQYAGARRYISS